MPSLTSTEWALWVSVVSMVVAVVALVEARRSRRSSAMATRKSDITAFEGLWRGAISLTSTSTPYDVTVAVTQLAGTARYWKEDPGLRDFIAENYGEAYQTLYLSLVQDHPSAVRPMELAELRTVHADLGARMKQKGAR